LCEKKRERRYGRRGEEGRRKSGRWEEIGIATSPSKVCLFFSSLDLCQKYNSNIN
jgi:hypothetical protein